MELPSLCGELGVCTVTVWVYMRPHLPSRIPSASVCVQQMAERIRSAQGRELGITRRDVETVELAGALQIMPQMSLTFSDLICLHYHAHYLVFFPVTSH